MKKEKETKGEFTAFRLSKQERTALFAAASICGIPVSALLRLLLAGLVRGIGGTHA
jgi:hypothetical protein